LRKPVKPVLGKRYAGSQVRREDLLNGNGEADLMGGEEEDDTFAQMDDGSEDHQFGNETASESEGVDLDKAHSKGRRKMKMLSGQVPEDEDEEIDSDEAFGENDATRFESFKFSGSRKKTNGSRIGSRDEDLLGTSGLGQRADGLQNGNGAGISDTDDGSETDAQGLSGDESDEDVNMLDGSDSEPTSDVSDTTPPVKKAAKQTALHGDRAALKVLLSSDTAAVASSLSAAASADAKKGGAVKVQYQTFDRLLDVRIKLQKSLTAANSIIPGQDFNEHKDAIQAAEEAALTLFNTITSIRHSFAEVQPPTNLSNHEKKRKRPSPATTSTPLPTLWSDIETLFSTSLPHHRSILNKWSAKVRASNPAASESTSRLLGNSNNRSQGSITNVIDAYIATETPKLIAQSTSTPNSNKPHPTLHPSPPPLTYDDTPFYQSLLRDLISSRRNAQSQSRSQQDPLSSSSSTTLPTTTNKLHPSGSHAKRIDTKASKGRKVRYTVHERLQNFMAAEGGVGEADKWHEEARREFFGSLMGGLGLGLGEEEEVVVVDREGSSGGVVVAAAAAAAAEEDDDDDGAEGEALRLFRS
jgi:protein AATF/BFR2